MLAKQTEVDRISDLATARSAPITDGTCGSKSASKGKRRKRKKRSKKQRGKYVLQEQNSKAHPSKQMKRKQKQKKGALSPSKRVLFSPAVTFTSDQLGPKREQSPNSAGLAAAAATSAKGMASTTTCSSIIKKKNPEAIRYQSPGYRLQLCNACPEHARCCCSC